MAVKVFGGVIYIEMFADPMSKVYLNPIRYIVPALFTGNFQYCDFIFLPQF